MASPCAVWPEQLIRAIVALVLEDEPPGQRLLSAMSLCGVSAHWRAVARELPPLLLAFDGAEGGGGPGPKATSSRFRRAPLAVKRALFSGAARLLHGYSEVTLSGEAVDDAVLAALGAANGAKLTAIRLLGAPAVTDEGLCALLSSTLRLRHLKVEDAGPGLKGSFVPHALAVCPTLESLHIEGADALCWAGLRASGAWWRPLPLPPAVSSQQQQQQPQQQQSATAMTNAQPAAVTSAMATLGGCTPAGPSSSSSSALLQPAGLSCDAAGGGAEREHGGSSASVAAGSRRQRTGRRRPTTRRRAISVDAQPGGLVSDDGGISSSEGGGGGGGSDDVDDDGCSSGGAASDATSISVPASALVADTSVLVLQLQQHSLVASHLGVRGEQQQQQLMAAVAASGPPAVPVPGTVAPTQLPLLQQQQQQQEEQQQQLLPPPSTKAAQQWGIPRHGTLRRLHVRGANVDSLHQLLERLPALTELSVDGPSCNVQLAAACCPGLQRVALLVSSPLELDAALFHLTAVPALRTLQLEVRGIMLSAEQLRVIGALPLRELSLDSHAYRQQPSMPRPQYSHLDNEGVKALVDSICMRMRTELVPLRLSLCGATALKQEAVSALLRLPMLTAIDTGGCIKLTPMDRMRLVAKVKAGQGLLEHAACPPSGALASLRVPHGAAL